MLISLYLMIEHIRMNKTLKVELLGLTSWLVPFLFSLFFYSSDGRLLIDDSFLNSMMIVLSAFTTSVLLVAYFRTERDDYLREGIILGLAWLLINIALDLVLFAPSSLLEVKIYLGNLGLRYFIIPVISISIGYLLEIKR